MKAVGIFLRYWTQKNDPDLVTSGPYRLVRRRICSGILVVGGTAVSLSWPWLIVVLLVGLCSVYGATLEERHQSEQFLKGLSGVQTFNQDACAFRLPRLSQLVAPALWSGGRQHILTLVGVIVSI